jgi:hypothetical protein
VCLLLHFVDIRRRDGQMKAHSFDPSSLIFLRSAARHRMRRTNDLAIPYVRGAET